MKNKPLLSSHPEVAAQSEFVIFPWGIFPHTQFFIFVLKYMKGDFPGNPVVKNLCFQGKFDWVVNLGLIG